MQEALKTIRESNIDGRAKYFRYRQRQLITLYNAINANRAEFVKAVEVDAKKSNFEAELEVTLTLRSLRLQYDGTDFKLLNERVAKLRSGGVLPTPFGAAFILGHSTAPLDSVLGPLSAAIAAGNVALILLPESAGTVFNLLSRHCYPALDTGAYIFQRGTPDNVKAALSEEFNIYFATSTDSSIRRGIAVAAQDRSSPCHLLPIRNEDKAQNICIVSKTTPRSDLARIARLIVRAKFCATAGRSLGALSFVCVHEELHDQLVQNLTEAATAFASSAKDYSPIDSKVDLSKRNFGSARVAYGDVSSTCILEKVPTDSELLDRHIPAPIIPVVPFTSTEEAINITGERLGNVLSVFANQLEIDYFANELKPHMLSANDIPLELLTGVCASSAWDDQTPPQRWSSSLFERPIRISGTAVTSGDASLVFPPFASYKVEAMRKALLPNALEVLRLKLKPHSNIIGRVFFLQGLFLSLGVILGSVALSTGFGGFKLYRYFFRH